jgi:hypothetical protein
MMEGKGPGADSEEKREPVSDIDTAVADSLKVLDLKWPAKQLLGRDVRRPAKENDLSFGVRASEDL